MGKTTRLTFEDVEQYFEDHGCKLLSTKYKNNKGKLWFLCECGNISETTFNSFKSGRRCKKCGAEKASIKRKHTFEYVYNCFKEQDCELLEKEYFNNHSLLSYQCICGEKSKITFASFQQGHRCKKCGQIKVAEKLKHTFEYVEQYFLDEGCVLLEKIYFNSSTLMNYICKNGHNNKITFSKFQQGQRCSKCYGNKKLTHEEVFNYFKERGCVLLETQYLNSRAMLKYICECGEESEITFNNFRQGHRCKKCGEERNREKKLGENNPNYNSNLTDEERQENKERSRGRYYRTWRKGVYERDYYTCQKCFIKGKYLNGHHIESWDSCPELRFDDDNGITFCVDCHIEFHKKYGYGNNTRQQLNEFLGIVLSCKK